MPFVFFFVTTFFNRNDKNVIDIIFYSHALFLSVSLSLTGLSKKQNVFIALRCNIDRKISFIVFV